MDRRAFLATAGVGLSVAVAGCSDDGESVDDDPSEDGSDDPGDGETDDSPASFDVEIDAPENAQVDEELSPSVSVTNTGGETGTFDDTLAFVDEDDGRLGDDSATYEEPFEVEVGPGETESVDLPEITFELADEYTLSLEDEGRDHTVDVGPRVAEVDSTVELESGLRLTLTEIAYETGVFYEYTPGAFRADVTSVQAPVADQIYVRFQFDLENAGTSSASVDATSLEVRNGDRIEQFDEASLSSATSFAGDPLENVSLGAGESGEGWVLIQLDREQAQKTVELAYQRDDSGTRPEITWVETPEDGTIALPRFELEGYDIEDELEVSEEATYEITVKNVGDRTGTFRGTIQWREPGDSDWEEWLSDAGSVEAELEPGEVETLTVDYRPDHVGEYEYRIQPFGERHSISYVTAKRERSEAFLTPDGRELSIDAVAQADSFTYGQYSKVTAEASEDSRFVSVRIEVYRTEQDASGSVSPTDFTLVSGDATFDRRWDGGNIEYYDPLEGIYADNIDAGYDQRETGVLVFEEISESISRDDLSLRWEDDDGAAVEWSL